MLLWLTWLLSVSGLECLWLPRNAGSHTYVKPWHLSIRKSPDMFILLCSLLHINRGAQNSTGSTQLLSLPAIGVIPPEPQLFPKLQHSETMMLRQAARSSGCFHIPSKYMQNAAGSTSVLDSHLPFPFKYYRDWVLRVQTKGRSYTSPINASS